MKGGPKGSPRNIASRVRDQIRAFLGVRMIARRQAKLESAAVARHDGIVTRLDLVTAQLAEIQAEARNIGLVASLPPERLSYRDLVANHHVPIAPPGPVRLTSSLCRQRDFTLDAHRYWTRLMRDPPRFHRKQWEFVFIAQALAERGQLAQGCAGIGFGVGREPLPALFASLGCRILATDQSTEEAARAGWTQSGQHADALASLRRLDICEEDRFDALVSFRNVDMNEIPQDLFGQFNFCWSSCCFEHLGSIEAGLQFVDHSMATLVPGGVAVHTTEFNLSSNDATLESRDLSIFRRRDIEALIDRLEKQGHRVEPMEWDEGEGLVDAYVDLPPYRAEPGLKLRIGTYDCTSIGLIIERGTLA